MNLLRKKFVGIFLLIFFLTPLVQKIIHDFSHANDVHCNIKSEQHLHEKEHNCKLCDYTIAAFSADSFPFFTSMYFVAGLFINFYKSHKFSHSFLSSYSLRGPPELTSL